MCELPRPVVSENAPVKKPIFKHARKPPSNLLTKQQNVESQFGNMRETNAYESG